VTLFLIPLPHPRSCRSYARMTALLEHTLRSVCNQEDGLFHVIVICHERPPVAFDHPNLTFLCVDFAPLPAPGVPGFRTEAGDGIQMRFSDKRIRTDKGCKFVLGLQHARALDPTHVMFVDCDDFISSRVSAFVRRHRGAHGWFLKEGYLYSHGSSQMALMGNFNRKCGSGEILPFQPLVWPKQVPVHASKEEILATVDNSFLEHVLGGHRHAPAYFAGRGMPLEPLGFRGAVWHVNHGENYSGMRPYGCRKRVPVTNALREEFSIPEIPSPASAP
jgi:hypothetical protein